MILAKEKTKEDYKKICLQLEYQLYILEERINKAIPQLENLVESIVITDNKQLEDIIEFLQYIIKILKGEENENK